jgi:hypothetical protein
MRRLRGFGDRGHRSTSGASGRRRDPIELQAASVLRGRCPVRKRSSGVTWRPAVERLMLPKRWPRRGIRVPSWSADHSCVRPLRLTALMVDDSPLSLWIARYETCYRGAIVRDEAASCASCERAILRPTTGRLARFCSVACRNAAYRRRRQSLPENTERVRPGGRRPLSLRIPNGRDDAI